MAQLKTGSSSRMIPVDDVVLRALAEQIRVWPRNDGLIFSSLMGRSLFLATLARVVPDVYPLWTRAAAQ